MMGLGFALMIAVLLSAEEGAPVDVFGELDGTWEGTFVGYDLEGIEQYRIQVRQVYRTVDDETQVVQIEDRMADGAVVRGEGANVARRLPDGSLELLCRVEKSNGDRVEHRGRLVSGPDGRKEIVWYSRESKRREMFREWVHHDAEGPVYAIEGVGQYGETTVVMSGRYRKID